MVKLFKKILIPLVILANFLVIPTASAAKANCTMLNPEKNEGYIITVLEEAIDEPTETENIITKTCFRITTITEKEGKKTYSSEYDDKCSPSETVQCQRVQALFAKSGTQLLMSYIGIIYRWAAGTIGIVSVLFLVWGGVEIATAGDDQSKIDGAKTRIMQSIAGLVLLFLSAIILYTINPNFFVL